MATSSQPAQLLTVPQVAERLQLTIGTVYLLIRRGELEAIRVSERGLRVSGEDLAAYLIQRNGGDA